MRLRFRKSTLVFKVSAELGILAGIVVAFYLVPGTTPSRTFWSVALAFGFVASFFVFVSTKQ
jgi:hypothetical protein